MDFINVGHLDGRLGTGAVFVYLSVYLVLTPPQQNQHRLSLELFDFLVCESPIFLISSQATLLQHHFYFNARYLDLDSNLERR